MDARTVAKVAMGFVASAGAGKVVKDILVPRLPEATGAICKAEYVVGMWALSGAAGFIGSHYAKGVVDDAFDLYEDIKKIVESWQEGKAVDDELREKIDEKADELRRAIDEFNNAGEEAEDGGAPDAGEDGAEA